MAVLTPGARVLYVTRFALMGGWAEVKFVDARGRTGAEALARKVEAEAMRIEAKFSRYLPGSSVSMVNRQAGLAAVPADGETRALVEAALELARLTGGRFDPTVGVLSRAWDFRRGQVPTEAELQALLPLVDAGAVRLGPDGLLLARAGMELDLGGVGKEYAVDRVADLLRDEGVSSALVNFSGDVRTVGRRGDGRPWSIGVQDPRAPGRCRFHIRARSRAGIATSGDYERCFERDGVRYHHLLDATTGRPARGLSSATVIAPTACAAGRLATAAFLLGREAGLALLEGLPSVEGALITEAGQVLATAGMARISNLG